MGLMIWRFYYKLADGTPQTAEFADVQKGEWVSPYKFVWRTPDEPDPQEHLFDCPIDKIEVELQQ